MDPVMDSDWLGIKQEPNDEVQNIGNVARSWQWRERGLNPLNYPSNKSVIENVAEDVLVKKCLNVRCCDLPGYPRSTFLMVFSPDGTKVASTHGNHNVYVSELASGKHVQILKGHPRTPWCIAFHPSHTQLIGSGCLGGQVRVWALSGGSEVWTVGRETVIASIAFHPRDQLLVIATSNELYFWDWSQPAPFTKVSTNNINEKVRFVAFDSLGYKLITGMTVWNSSGMATSLSHALSHNLTPNTQNSTENTQENRNEEGSGSAQEMIVTSYHNLVQRYDSLVRNYRRLFLARHHLINSSTTNTTDRGTDPMETDFSGPQTSSNDASTSTARSSRSTENDDSTGRRRNEGSDGGDSESGSSRLLNLDVLSLDPSNTTTRSQDGAQSGSATHQNHILFGSRRSAFQALAENSDRRFSFMSADRSQRTIPRILPNPFSSTSSSTHSTLQRNDSNGHRTGHSRPNIFISQGQEIPPTRYFIQRRGHSTVSQPQVTAPEQTTATSSSQSVPISDSLSGSLPSSIHTTSRSTEISSTEFGTVSPNQRPSTVNSSTQISPATNQTINESLDLIRDILRDSGTRLLNLITNMSLSTLASVERSIPRRSSTSHTHSESSDRAQRTRNRQSRIRLFSPHFRNEFLSSGSESDNDPSLEVNIYRTRNSSFPARNLENTDDQLETDDHLSYRPTDRMIVDLDLDDDMRNNNDNSSSEPNVTSNRINIRVSNNRFRVRTQNENNQNVSNDNSSTRTSQENNGNSMQQESPLDFRTSRASTSRDNYWMNDPLSLDPDRSSSGPISSEEAYRRVKLGVNALQKHTGMLTNMWLHGTRTSMQELRHMWENLRRRVLSLQRQSGRQDVPSYYTRSIMERCRILTEMSRNISSDLATRINLNTRQRILDAQTESSERTQQNTERTRSQPRRNETSATNEPSTSSGTGNEAVNSQTRSPKSTARSPRSNASSRRRVRSLVESLRSRSNNELRRRSRISNPSRWSLRHPNRQGRRENNRAVELHCTRNEIRVRAMQVLSVMFNMMMSCLEERGLSQLIMFMLRTLKKALGLTCLLLMTNRLNRNSDNRSTNQNSESSNINQSGPSSSEPQRNSEHTHGTVPNSSDVNMEQNDASNSTSPWPTSETEEENPYHDTRQVEQQNNANNINNLVEPLTLNNRSSPMSHKWSNRLAVQISAANRNFSATARHRRELYLEFKRQKALHRCNPHAHPITKKKMSPPTTTYRIPALRVGPIKNSNTSGLGVPPGRTPAPVIPSPPLNPADGGSSPSEGVGLHVDRGFDSPTVRQRINFFRMAQLHAFRLRNAARNRIRRLQTIQLYTPSSVREMFAWQPPSNENPPDRSAINGLRELANLIPLNAFRPRFHPPRSGVSESREPQFEFFLNDQPPTDAQRGTANNTSPRIHEYLQPIILAQNALVMEEVGGAGGGGGGGGGSGGGGGAAVGGIPLGAPGGHEAAFVSETLGAPTHRVQAWDFTTGCPPDIHDNTKNIVVQRCRIHNDASIDISKDGKLLVALLPLPRLRNMNHRLGVYSLEWGRLGQCLHTASLEQSAVSVALSPTGRHLAVGLGSRRFTTLPHARNNVFGLLYKLSPLESSSRTGLLPVRELEHNWEHGFTSLNCLRWAPQPGQGLVYANNTGQLVIMS